MPDFNEMQRRRLAARNQAMPNGSYPIRNVSDLKNAIQAYGRAKNKQAAKAWIKKRAKDLGREDLLPDNWRTDVLVHYGIKGQKWGIRRYQNEDGTLTEAGKKRVAKQEIKSTVKGYRTSRKTDPKTDFLKINRPNSAARTYYRRERATNLITYRNSGHNLDKKVSGLSKEQIENGRYRVARARNIRRKTIAALTATGVTLATGGIVPLGVLAGVGMNFINGGHYYQGESATYGTRRAQREIKAKKKKDNS